MYLRIFNDTKPQTHPANQSKPAIVFPRLYGGALVGETISQPLVEVNTRVIWKPVHDTDIVTYIRYAI